MELIIGGKYNWKNQEERLLYLGHNWSGNGFWHQFSLVSDPEVVWCELQPSDLSLLEETVNPIEKAEASGTAMAKRKKLLFNRWEVSAHKITDNPYHRKMDKAEHVAWHNAFYFARKEMNRGVW